MVTTRRVPWFVLCYLAVLLASCSTGVDSELFNDSACKAPCWHGLTPGTSSAGDVERFVDDLNPFWWPDKAVHNNGVDVEWIRIIDRTKSKFVDFYIEDAMLTFIRSSGSTTSTLGQVVEHFGAPEYVLAVLAVGPDGRLYQLEVYYPNRGLSFEISPSGLETSANQPDIGRISPSMPVNAIQYYQPGNLRSYAMVRHPAFAEVEIEKYLQPWPGFGTVRVIETH